VAAALAAAFAAAFAAGCGCWGAAVQRVFGWPALSKGGLALLVLGGDAGRTVHGCGSELAVGAPVPCVVCAFFNRDRCVFCPLFPSASFAGIRSTLSWQEPEPS
jgi:hypothetical protein